MATIAVIHDTPTPTASDTALRNFIAAAGHTCDLVVESSTTPVDEGTYDAVVISESGSGSAINPYVDWPGGVLCFEVDWGVLGLTTGPASSSGVSSTDIDLTGTHEVNDGFANPLGIFGAAQTLYGVPTGNLQASVEATALASGSTHIVACVADAAVTDPAAGRRAGMGLISDRPGALDADGQAYVVALVEWVANVSTVSQGGATGTHAWSGVATGTNRPATPTGLTATPVAADQIDLSWNAVTGATGYDIERDGVVVVTGHATTAYSDTGLAPATQYSYRVRAVN